MKSISNPTDAREGVTVLKRIAAPKGCGPDYTVRFWGQSDTEAIGKLDAYLAQLPEGFIPDTAIERRLGH